ncbi:YdeI/OmpD-associated family protein [Pontixanthobacter sp.]|uniref:DUF1905 domain-containing protein n=1 Tax=Pontixanthobacter sp. TaxID=2792078 RepID=UPI003C7AE0AB
MYEYEFSAEIEMSGVGKERKIWYHVIFLPGRIKQQLPFEKFPRLRVEGEIADIPIANAFLPAGDGRHYLIVAPAIRKSAQLSVGDIADVRFTIADQNHVEIADALKQELANDRAFAASWDALTPGKRRMAAQHVVSARTEPTRKKRVQEARDIVMKFSGDVRAWRGARRAAP